MSLSGVMATLADQYVIGIIICCLIVSGLYIAFSVRLIITARSEGMNICATAMIPFYQIILWVIKCFRRHKRIKRVKEKQKLELEEVKK